LPKAAKLIKLAELVIDEFRKYLASMYPDGELQPNFRGKQIDKKCRLKIKLILFNPNMFEQMIF
jgi:hypothetical protein